jgi:putative tryptophan/tyrosine transport system substrate-binding protein
MRRREFITLLCGMAAWPSAARVQGSVAIVGFAVSGSRANQDPIAGFEAGLKEMGFVEGQNLAVEYRFAEGRLDRLPALISDLVQRKVAVLVVSTPKVRWLQNKRRLRSRSFSLLAPIQSRLDLYRASISLAET